ncbi:hypothetical protein EMIT0111MI5_10009 [Burkholderia sp. IT-111MI5]
MRMGDRVESAFGGGVVVCKGSFMSDRHISRLCM